jgi:hypothetical protein
MTRSGSQRRTLLHYLICERELDGQLMTAVGKPPILTAAETALARLAATGS